MIQQQESTQYPGMPAPAPSAPPTGRRTVEGVSQAVTTAILVALAFCAGWFGNIYVTHNTVASPQDLNAQAILQAYQAISQGYVDVDAINQKKMAYAAIGAMVDSLGDTGHSRFQTPEEIQQENNQLQNKPTVGIGVLLSGGGATPLRINEVVPGSAADAGGLRPGDQIVGVNGQDITGKTIDQVRPQIVGAEGTQVTLTIRRPGEAKPFDVTLTRRPFTFPLVSSYLIPGTNLAHIQITQFAASESDDTNNTDSALQAVLKQPEVAAADGIILDLRENPGGLLDQAVKVSSEFVPEGQGHNVYILQTRAAKTPIKVNAGGLATTKPLVVLVNNDTASAAEIVTAAIAYNRPSVHVVGEHTFGTHTILTPVPLANGGQILLGVEGWLTPGGQNVRGTGILPDQPVTMPENGIEITPLLANETHLTLAQIQAGSDPQLIQAIKDLMP